MSKNPLDYLPPPKASPLDSWRGLGGWLAGFSIVLGCLLTLTVWLVVKLTGDAWHWGTVLLFAPRWLGLIPWAIGTPLLLFARPWQRWLWITTGVIGGISLMGFNIPIPRWHSQDGTTLRVMTCNIQKDEISLFGIESLIEEYDLDIVFLQEFNSEGTIQWPAGWHAFSDRGQCIGSRFPMTKKAVCQQDPTNDRSRTSGLLATLQLPNQTVNVASLHLLTPRWGLAEVLSQDGTQLDGRFERLKSETDMRSAESEWTRVACDRFGALDIVAGDFNMPVDSRILVRDWGSYRDAFASAGWGLGYTKYETFRGWNLRARIDHILVKPDLVTKWCEVGRDVGSDHRPVIAEIELPSQ